MIRNMPFPATLLDLFWKEASAARELMLVLMASFFLALTAQVAVPLPFSPVPITAQTFGLLLMAAALGRQRSVLAVLAYLGEGAMGLPVFAQGGAGITWLVGPTGGYLVGFVAAAWVVGWLSEHGWDRRPLTSVVAMLAGNSVIYPLGLLWLARFVGPEKALALGFYPFIVGDMVKIGLAALALPAAWALVGRAKRS